MAGVRNEFSEAMMKIVGDFRTLHERAVKSKATPFGQEKVSPRELRARVMSLTAEQRRTLLEKPEMREQILAAIREDE